MNSRMFIFNSLDPITIILIASMAVIGVFISLVALCLGNNAYRESTLQLFGSLCSPEKRDELGEL